MTAICLQVTTDYIVIAADGASYDNKGRVVGPVSKIFPVAHLNCVLSNTGLGGMATVCIHEIGNRYGSFDALLDDATSIMRGAHERLTFGQANAPRATMIFAGWLAAEQRFAAFKMHSSEREVYADPDQTVTTLAPPWTLLPIDGFWASNAPTLEVMEECGVNQQQSPFDLTARMVCASRRSSGVDNGDGVFGVGCFLEVALLTRERFASRIVHRWPDIIGQPIDPEAGEKMPAFPIPVP